MEVDEIRCPSRIVGVVRDGRLEVKCSSKHCGAGNGTIVIHYFDLLTGELLETRKFQEPARRFSTKKEAPATCR